MRPCSRWGLPCRPRYRGRGGLLPRPFTLTVGPPKRRATAVFFLLHSPRRFRHRALPGIVLCGARTFLPPRRSAGPATARAASTPRNVHRAGRRRNRSAPARRPGGGAARHRQVARPSDAPCGARTRASRRTARRRGRSGPRRRTRRARTPVARDDGRRDRDDAPARVRRARPPASAASSGSASVPDPAVQRHSRNRAQRAQPTFARTARSPVHAPAGHERREQRRVGTRSVSKAPSARLRALVERVRRCSRAGTREPRRSSRTSPRASRARARPRPRGERPMSRHAARSKHASFAASSQTVAHSAGTGIGCQAPVSVVAPMSRFHPPLTLTSAHRCMRAQLRAVHGSTHASATGARRPRRRQSATARRPLRGHRQRAEHRREGETLRAARASRRPERDPAPASHRQAPRRARRARRRRAPPPRGAETQ